ncbi:MAG: DUF1926 domain-containing protein [Candidatus Omnitrophica bacterium]|nr:DUF1926 domain-containing protein [Candidatus Omnitrophota bacterium]
MSAPVTLLMAVHCHQPVGNFGFVFEEAYAKAYEPFLRVLERHPGVRLALHYSGCLLDWLRSHQPGFLSRVKALAARGQVELLAGGYYEPILPLLPEADRRGQLAQMQAALRARFGTEASGCWLTERVWEPDLPATLAAAGLRYTMVDANQFAPAAAWLPPHLQVRDDAFWDLLGCYTTEYAGSSITLFPSSKRLRYWLPFQPVERTIAFLKRLRRDEPVAITFADDGEKFGFWPETHHWVYDEGWLDQFLTALEREAGWLSTATFRDYLAERRPDGRAYLPCGSYEEMLEWSGGHFRNFFAKYPEANAMQQKMLRTSRQLQALRSLRRAPGALLARAARELYTGQCNCAYWHGVFGGLYLSHLRRAVYAHLIAAEELASRAAGDAPSVTALDADGDGVEEVRLRTNAMSLILDPEEGGAVTEWILPAARLNLVDTLTRRPEPYHSKLRATALQAVAAGASSAPASIHDLVGVKERDLESCLVYDDHRRSAFLDYALPRLPTLEEVVRSGWTEQRLWPAGPFRWRKSRGRARATLVRDVDGGRILKTLRLDARRPSVECRYELDGVDVPVAALEFNVSLRDGRYLSLPGQGAGVASFDIEEPALGVTLRLAIDPPATVYHFPIETVSESEGGLERTYQGLCLVCCWALQPRRTQPWACRVRWSAEMAQT